MYLKLSLVYVTENAGTLVNVCSSLVFLLHFCTHTHRCTRTAVVAGFGQRTVLFTRQLLVKLFTCLEVLLAQEPDECALSRPPSV